MWNRGRGGRMKHDPRARRKFPEKWDKLIFESLDQINEIRYERIPFTAPPDAKLSANYYAVAKVWYHRDDDKYFLIEYDTRPPVGKYSYQNQASKDSRQRRLAYWKAQGIPVLIVSKRLYQLEYYYKIKKFIDDIKKGE